MDKKKFKGNTKEVLKACDEAKEAFREIKSVVYSYAKTQKSIKSSIDKVKIYREVYKDDDPWLFDVLIEDLTVLSVMSLGEHIKSCLKQSHEMLFNSSLPLLSYWEKNPFYFSVFKIEEIFNDDLYSIRDIYSDKKSLFYSPSLREKFTNSTLSKTLFYTILFDNGSCLQSGGYIFSTFLRKNDFMFMLSVLVKSPISSITKDVVTKAVLEHYSRFSLIFLVSEDPYNVISSYEMSYTFSSHKIEQDFTSFFEGSEYLEKVGTTQEVDIFQLKRTSIEMRDLFIKEFPHRDSFYDDVNKKDIQSFLISHLLYHKESKDVFIQSDTIEGYYMMRIFFELFIVSSFEPVTAIPSIENLMGRNMYSIHRGLLSIMRDYFPSNILPWSPFVSSFWQQELAKKDMSYDELVLETEMLEKGLARNNDTLKDFIDRFATLLKDFGNSRTSKSYVDPAQLELFASGPADKGALFVHTYPLKRITILDEDIVARLELPFPDGDIFYCIQKSDEGLGFLGLEALRALGNDTFKDLVYLYDFPEALFSLSDYFNEEISDAILNAIIFIMFFYPNEWVSVHAICLTIIQNFKEILFSKYDFSEAIIKDISQFIYSSLCTSGILQVNGRVKKDVRENGSYAVKINELFNAMFLLNEEFRGYTTHSLFHT